MKLFLFRGTNAIKMLKEDIHVGLEGILDPKTGQVWGSINPAEVDVKIFFVFVFNILERRNFRTGCRWLGL